MPKKEKRMVIILVVIAVIAIIVFAVWSNSKKKENVPNTTNQNVAEEKYVQTLDDGTKLNVSPKLKDTKTVEGLEISDFQITQSGEGSLLLGTITNKTDKALGNFVAEIVMVNDKGEEIYKTQVYIQPLEAGQSAQLSTGGGRDFANVYDFTIKKIEG